MELTLKYYHYFGSSGKELGENLNTSGSWDVLRTKEGVEGDFYISDDRRAWQNIALNNNMLKVQAADIVNVISPEFNSIHSFGVGAAHLEFLIKRKCPSLAMKCSDFTPHGIERLKKVFVEAEEITIFDMLKGDWPTMDAGHICLLYRVDTVFDDSQWREVLRKMNAAGIKNILFIPSDVLTVRKILYQLFKYVVFRGFRREMIFSGYLRTRPRLESLFEECYTVERTTRIGGLIGFFLKTRNGR